MEKPQARIIKELEPRCYQLELLKVACESNTILYLPTGTGKTYIAIMLIRQMAADICNKEFSQGAKRTIYLANSVCLVQQQAQYLTEQLPYSIGYYTGDKNVDMWTKSKWHQEFAKYHVLVATPQILLNILLHGYISIDNFNLLIFDECHQAVGSHPMRLIMMEYIKLTENRPRVLGLSATLLNRNINVKNIESEILNLEQTYQAKVVTTESLHAVLEFDTKPFEQLIPCPVNIVSSRTMKIENMLKETILIVEQLNVSSNSEPISNEKLLFRSQEVGKKVVNVLKDLIENISELGYYGTSWGILATIISFEKNKKTTKTTGKLKLYQYVINRLEKIRAIMVAEMGDISMEKIRQFSSTKVNYLFNVLQDFDKKDFASLIFVKKRSTAKTLFFTLRHVALNSPSHEFIKCNFVTGFSRYSGQDTVEGLYESKKHEDILLQFKEKKINVLICTNVLEEGIDIPTCSLVLMFDIPNNYRSYIQSKGRARHKNSKYIIFYYTNEINMITLYQEYKTIDSIVHNLINGKKLSMETNTENDDDDSDYLDLNYMVPSTGALCTLISATSLLYRYCASLPQDRFTTLEPLWYWENEQKRAIVIELPTVSPIRNKIIGPRLNGIKKCKQGVALEAIKILHQGKELNDNLIPINRKKISFEDMSYLFSHWDKENDSLNLPKPGTNNRKRPYTRQCPKIWKHCNPSMGGETLYLHVIKMEYISPAESSARSSLFYKIYSSTKTYAILSSKKMNPLCDFSIFPNHCEVLVTIDMNKKFKDISKIDFQILQRFHAFIFIRVLKLIKSYTIFDLNNDDYSLLIVPVDLVNGTYQIDMETAKKYFEMESVVEPNILTKRNIVVREEDYVGAIVFPWYRNIDTEYLVCQVDQNLNANSPFPSESFDNFASYFKEKWNIAIENQSAPLILVQAISKTMNFSKPSKRSKRENAHRNQFENFEEHFIPELCVRMSFPGLWWLKAKCLPTILHRIHLLSNADEFRRKIVNETGLGQLDPITKWEPLPLLKDVKQKYQNYDLDQPVACQDIVLGRVSPPAMVFDLKDLKLQRKYQWKKHNEPIDIERDIEKVTLLDIEFYERFVSQDLNIVETEKSAHKAVAPQFAIEYHNENVININLLEKNNEKGPELWHILQALTSAGSNDVVNLERLEILGDSFLKFSTSLFLTLKYPLWDEGRLTTVKGTIVGNKNLFYCAKMLNIGSLMNNIEFDPNAEWFPPRFYLPRFIAELLTTLNLPISTLFMFDITEDEQMRGILFPETVKTILQRMTEFTKSAELEDEEENKLNMNYQQHLISDKTMADCIEALIGCYLLSNGIYGAFKILSFLHVLPPADDYTKLMVQPSPSPFLDITGSNVSVSDVDFYLPHWQYLEEKLGYSFKNRGYLLQALTHPSFISNRLTPCYQRLEFVGDAVLDFLITCYIYEHCGDLDPGEVTDLRSALVNNVVFATLTVRNDFHKFILMLNPLLSQVIDKFVQHQIKHNHVVNNEVLLFSQENEVELAEYVNVPKTLGDIFESLMGAIFFDSGMDLKVVWKVAYKLMIKEIHQFSANIPKNPIRLLFETHGANPRYENVTLDKNSDYVMIRLSFTVDGTKQFVYGCGGNTKDAKLAAAKIALQTILLSQSIDNKDIFL